MKERLKKCLPIALPVVITVIFSYYLQIYFQSNQSETTKWFSEYGPFAIFVYIVLQSVAIIFPPLNGMAFLLALIAVIGPKAIFLYYFVVTPCYVVNFILAKKFGRRFVERVVDQQILLKFDHLSSDAGIPALVALKIFQSGMFDYISYIAGLSGISLRDFVKVNVLAGVPGAFLLYVIFLNSKNITSGLIAHYWIGAILTIIWVFINHNRKHRKQ
ncbi:MAG TPA: VTT domain-containing protein [Patescibacteria group bacterium]|nr:VTT domain-containing protein [Patescibacteria group bacterium]